MMRRIKGKLSSHAGESIAETLFALLISSLALIMLAGAVSSAMRVVTGSKEKIDVYYRANNVLADRSDAPETLTVDIIGLLPSGEEISVNYWENDTLSGVPVIAYSRSGS